MKKELMLKSMLLIVIVALAGILSFQFTPFKSSLDVNYSLISLLNNAAARGESSQDECEIHSCKIRFCSHHNNYNECTSNGTLDSCSKKSSCP